VATCRLQRGAESGTGPIIQRVHAISRETLSMKRIVLFVACCFLTAPSFAESALAPRVVGPVTMWSAADADLIDSAWLHVKFVEGMETAIAGDRFTDPTLDLSPVNAALQRARAVEVRRTFPRERALLREWKQA